MKLDPSVFRFLEKDDFRVLTAVEMGMKNHQWVPMQLIESIASLRRSGTYKTLCVLLKHKLVAHNRQKYDGYKLTYSGYDYLALRALVTKGIIQGVGSRMGVGKESDIHLCEGPDGEPLILKLHRLGRVSFRTIKQNRDYLQHRKSASWMYMARLAATKEFAYLKALKEAGFVVPRPVEQNRHCIVMQYIPARPLVRIRALQQPLELLERLMRTLVKLCRAGVIHGDFNEFNLLVDDRECVTLIDFPQVVVTSHPNAKLYFDRDVKGVRDFFRRRFAIETETWPTFEDALSPAGGEAICTVPALSAADEALLGEALQEAFAARESAEGVGGVGGVEGEGAEGEGEGSSSSSEEAKEEAEESDAEDAASPPSGAEDGASPSSPRSGAENKVPSLVDAGEAGPLVKAETGASATPSFEAKRRDRAGAPEDGRPASSTDAEAHVAAESSDSSGEESGGPQVANQIGVLRRKKVSAEEAKTRLQNARKKQARKSNCQKNRDKRKAKQETLAAMREF